MILSARSLSFTARQLLLAALLGIYVNAQAEVWVITDQAHRISNAGNARVILLDEQQRLEARLTANLPSDLSHATTTIQSYLASPDGERLQRELVHAQQGLTDAWSLGVLKIPAVVVDRKYVVYGERNVSDAVDRINRTRGESE
jgi:integrating conjugative element protein (TIGR03757 family)